MTPPYTERPGKIVVNSWAGAIETPVTVIGETPKKYKVRLLANCRLPPRYRIGKIGQVITIPKHAIHFVTIEVS